MKRRWRIWFTACRRGKASSSCPARWVQARPPCSSACGTIWNPSIIEFAFLFNSRINPDQFFEMIAYDLNLNCARTSKTEVLFALNELLVEQAKEGRTVVLIVDEAHNLEWEVLEEIRLLGNLENRNGKLLQIILSGQPELDRKLDAPNLRQLKQRMVLRCNLQPFTLRDAVEYMESRLEKAGMPRSDRIFRGTDGGDPHPRPGNSARDQCPVRQPAADRVRPGEKDLQRGDAGRSLPRYAPGVARQPPVAARVSPEESFERERTPYRFRGSSTGMAAERISVLAEYTNAAPAFTVNRYSERFHDLVYLVAPC